MAYEYQELFLPIIGTAAAAAVPPVANLAALAAIMNPQIGWLRYVISEQALFFYNGGNWEEIDVAIDGGTY